MCELCDALGISNEGNDGNEGLHYIAEGTNLLMGGDAGHVANVIDAETERVNARVRLAEVELETMRFRAEREDINYSRMQDAANELKQALRNPLADFLGTASGGLFGGFPGFDGRTSAD